MEIPEDFNNLTGRDLIAVNVENFIKAINNEFIGSALFNTIQELKGEQSKFFFFFLSSQPISVQFYPLHLKEQ